MPKIYVRVNPRSQISKRHRCATEFTQNWKELDADAATRAALEEDPYLEVSDTPTVLVEVAATAQAAAPEAAIEPITPESTAAEDSTQGEISVQNGAGVESAESSGGELENVGANDNSPAQATGDADAAAENNATDLRIGAIKAAIAQLDPNNSEQWLSDGKPVIDAITALTGFKVLAAERDQAWSQIKTQAAAD